VDTGPGVAHHVADVVVPGLPGRQARVFEPFEHAGQVADRETLDLDVSPRRYVEDAVAHARDLSQRASLLGRELAAGDAHPDHVPAIFNPLAVEDAVPLEPFEIGLVD